MIEPTANVPSGLERLRRHVDGFPHYVEVETFPGGCFIASVLAEVDVHPGAVGDRFVDSLDDWLARLDDAVRQAQADGATAPAEDTGQLAFEIEASLLLANARCVVTRTPLPLQRARRAIERRLAAAGARSRVCDGTLERISEATGDTLSSRLRRNDRVRRTASVSLVKSERSPRTEAVAQSPASVRVGEDDSGHGPELH